MARTGFLGTQPPKNGESRPVLVPCLGLGRLNVRISELWKISNGAGRTEQPES